MQAALVFGACDCRGGKDGVGELAVSPGVLDIGRVSVGLVGRGAIDLENPGSGRVSILEARPDVNLSREIRLEGTPAGLVVGGRHRLVVVFTPDTVGPREGEIIFRTDSPITPEVRVRFLALVVDPKLRVTPAEIDFGRVTVGAIRTSTVHIENVGTEDVVVRAVSADVGSSDQFQAPLLGSRTLHPGDAFDLEAFYAPTSSGFASARFVIADDTNVPVRASFLVSGQGATSEIDVDPSAIVFTGLFAGESRTRFFDLRNSGVTAHTVSTLALVGAPVDTDFVLDTSTAAETPFQLLPGEERRIRVTYAPDQPGSEVQRIEIESTGLMEPLFVELSGSAADAPIAGLDIVPPRLDFGRVRVGTTSVRYVRVRNLGTIDVHVTQTAAIQPPSAPYALGDPLFAGATLAPSDDHLMRVELTPAGIGPMPAAALALWSDDPDALSVSIPLTGQGVTASVPDLSIEPEVIEAGRVPRGTEVVRRVVLQSSGSATVTVSRVALIADAGGLFTLSSGFSVPRTIAPGARQEVELVFLDAAGPAAAHQGVLRIESDDDDLPAVDVPLTAWTEDPSEVDPDLSISMMWTGGGDVDLHLVRTGGALFDRPSDCCFCSPNPAWGERLEGRDDPLLDRNAAIAPGPERITLEVAAIGEYAVIVHHFDDFGAGEADVELSLAWRGAPLAVVSRRIAVGQRWDAGAVVFDGANGTFMPFDVPLGPSLRRACF